MNDFVAGLPAPVRHVAGAFIGAYVAFVCAAVYAAGGVTGIEWGGTLAGGLDQAALAAVGVLVAFYVTPLTDAYGVGSSSSEGLPSPELEELQESGDSDESEDVGVH